MDPEMAILENFRQKNNKSNSRDPTPKPTLEPSEILSDRPRKLPLRPMRVYKGHIESNRYYAPEKDRSESLVRGHNSVRRGKLLRYSELQKRDSVVISDRFKSESPDEDKPVYMSHHMPKPSRLNLRQQAIVERSR